MSTARSPITTHVLDISLGRPAAGIPVRLSHMANGEWNEIGAGETDADGRVSTLLQPGSLELGTYKIHFALEGYFESGKRKSFYPYVDIVFLIETTTEHFHVPLLLSPFGYSTYRGS